VFETWILVIEYCLYLIESEALRVEDLFLGYCFFEKRSFLKVVLWIFVIRYCFGFRVSDFRPLLNRDLSFRRNINGALDTGIGFGLDDWVYGS